jgi:hypothetical protein
MSLPMANRQHPSPSNARKESGLTHLLAYAAAFDHRTRVTGNDVDVAGGRWTLSFDNGCTLALSADGAIDFRCPEPPAEGTAGR